MSATDNQKPSAEAQREAVLCCTDLLGCPNCKSTNIIKLWRAEIVLPGDNSDNSTKGYRYGCHDCDSIFYAR
jgi:hypothetical protein